MKVKFTARDWLAIILIVFVVLLAWFIFIGMLLKLAVAGYVFPAWFLLVIVTFFALKRKQE